MWNYLVSFNFQFNSNYFLSQNRKYISYQDYWVLVLHKSYTLLNLVHMSDFIIARSHCDEKIVDSNKIWVPIFFRRTGKNCRCFPTVKLSFMREYRQLTKLYVRPQYKTKNYYCNSREEGGGFILDFVRSRYVTVWFTNAGLSLIFCKEKLTARSWWERSALSSTSLLIFIALLEYLRRNAFRDPYLLYRCTDKKRI